MSDDSAPVIKAAGGIVYRRHEPGNRFTLLSISASMGNGVCRRASYDLTKAGRTQQSGRFMKTGSVSNVLEPAAVNGHLVKGIPKVSVFFAMEASNSPAFTPSHEVDRVDWLKDAEIRRRLSHGGERRAFDEMSVRQPRAEKSRSSMTSPSALKRNDDTPARSSVPPSLSLVCALQDTAA